MGTRTTHTGYLRQRGNAANTKRPAQGGPTPAVSLMMTPEFSFDPTQASSTEVDEIVLPKGAVPLFALITDGGATGGTSPTVDIGLADGNADALVADAAADAKSAMLETGTSLLTALTTDTKVTAGVGDSAATGGTVKARVAYFVDDDGALND